MNVQNKPFYIRFFSVGMALSLIERSVSKAAASFHTYSDCLFFKCIFMHETFKLES